MKSNKKEKWTRREFIRTVGSGLVVATAASNIGPFIVGCGKRETGSIIIGHQVDLTGGLASWGYWIDKGAKAAVERINNEGGIDGRQIKLIVEDTETNPSTGVRKLRKLILQDKCDFVLGTVHSGIMLASIPMARELKTVYFPLGMASEATAEKGNRYIFRISTHVREQVQAAGDWVFNNVSKNWTIVAADYAWGWSHKKWFTKKIEELGGRILDAILVPQGTKDFFPYIGKIPKNTEAIYFLFFGADSIGFVQQLHESGYRGHKFAVICTLEAIDLEKLGEAAEETWLVEYLPRRLEGYDTEYNRELRKMVGVDEDGRKIEKPDRTIAGSHYWAHYEHVYLIKKAIEASRWKSKKDTAKVIETLEGMQVKEGYAHPQGDKFIRAEDHQGFHQHWMSRVENGKLKVKFQIPTEKVIYPPTVDYRKESLS